MTSTETTTKTQSTTVATSGLCANIDDIKDENVLREMWQEIEDGDAKRQIRSRMYKLREERLKEFYGREGQGFLDNILSSGGDDSGAVATVTMEGTQHRTVTRTECHTVDGAVVQSKTTQAKQTVNKVLESDGDNVLITTTTTRTTGAGGAEEEETNVTRARINNRDRTSQIQEVKSPQHRQSVKASSSSGQRENVSTIKVLSKRSSVDSDISSTNRTSTASNKSKNNNSMTNGVVSKRKQTTTTTSTSGGSGAASGGGKVTTTKTIVTTAVTTAQAPPPAETSEPHAIAIPIRREDAAGGNREIVVADTGNTRSVASLARNFEQAEFSAMSTMTMSQMSTQSVVMTSSSSSSSRAARENNNTMMITPGEGATRVSSQATRTVVTSSGTGGGGIMHVDDQNSALRGNEKLEVGKVVIKEMGNNAVTSGGVAGAVNEYSATTSTSTATAQTTSSQNRSSSTTRSQLRSSSPTGNRVGDRWVNSLRSDASTLMNGDGTTDNKKSTRRSASTTRTTTGKNETIDRMSSTVSTKSTRSSSASKTPANNVARSRSPSAPIGKNEEQGASPAAAQEKVCRRTNKLSTTESTQKTRTSRRQAAAQDDKSPSPASTPRQKGSSSSPQGKATRTPSKSRAPASNQPTGQPEKPATKDSSPTNQKALPKDGSDKATKITEEKIMRELDILDTYLSQRSASIDEGNRDESGAVAKINGSLGEERRVKKSDKNFTVGKVSKPAAASITATSTTTTVETDVMESGAEPPFTRTTYKYTCPDENHHPHSHKPNRTTDHHSPEKSPERSGAVDERKRSPEKNKPGVRSDKNDIEDQIIATSEVSTTTTTTTSSGRKTDRPRSVGTSSRTPSSSPTKPDNKSGKAKRPSSLSPEKAKRNNAASSNKTDEVKETPVTSRKAHRTQDESPGRKPSSAPAKSAPLSSLKKKDLTESTAKTNEQITKSQVTTTTREAQERKSIITQQGMTKEEKYEADILSRPSVFTARKATAVKSSTTTNATTHSKPEPNPRARKSSDSSPERDVPASRPTVVREHLKSQEKNQVQPDDVFEEDEESPLNPPKKFTTSGLESPGAVLKAKSLFETKAQEAAKDRSSIELGSRVNTSPKLTVSKKAALFEARSRGERVSVSSESTHSLNEDNDDKHSSGVPSAAALQERRYTTCRIPEPNERAVSMERRVSVVTVIQTDAKILQSDTITSGAEITEEVTEEEVNSAKPGIRENGKAGRVPRTQPVRQDSGKIARTSISGETQKSPSSSSTTPSKAEPRNKSPSRQQKPEKNIVESGGTTPRKSSSTPRGQSPERAPQQKLNLRQTEQQIQVAKESNNIASSVVRTTSTQKKDVVEENNNKRNSIAMDSAEKVPMKKRDSKPKIDKQSEKLPDNFDQGKRRDSRGITGTMASSKIIENRKILQDIEQTNLENRQEKLVDGAESKEILTSDNQTTLSELKSTNVVRQSMRQAQESVSVAAAATIVTEEKIVTVSASPIQPVGKDEEKTPARNESVPSARSISKKSDSFSRKIKSKSPERAESPGKVVPATGETTIVNAATVVERRRSSNIIEKKVEAIMASFKQTSSSSITASSSTRMTTAELNAVEEMDNIEELEALLDKATDYDERSKIRGRIRFLKRKTTLVKRTGELGSPDRQLPDDDRQKPLQNTNAVPARATPHESSPERRLPKEKKVTSRKPSNEISPDKKVTSRKSSDELMKKSVRKSSMDKENVIIETSSRQSRGPSPQKSDRQSPPRGRPTGDIPQPDNRDTSSPRRSVEKTVTTTRTVGSRSNSGKIIVNATNKIEDDKKISEKPEIEDSKKASPSEQKTTLDKTNEKQRKFSSETTELLSTRSYSRDQIRVGRKREDETSISESQTIQDQDLYSSRRSSRNLEDEKSDVEEARRTIRKSESPSRLTKQERDKHEDTIVQDKPSGQQTPKSSKPSSRATSPQRSEIPISARMKRERSLSPPKIPLKEAEIQMETTAMTTASKLVERTETPVAVIAVEKADSPIKKPIDADSDVDEKEEKQPETKDDKVETSKTTSSKASTATTSSRRVSSRKPSGEISSDEKPDKSGSSVTQERRAMTKEEKYEADILSRPSVFTARKATAVKEASPAPVKKKSPSPERETRTTPSRMSPQRSAPVTTSPSDSSRDASSRSSVTRGDSSRSITSSRTIQSSSTATTVELAARSEESGADELSTTTTTTKASRGNQYTRRESSKELKPKDKESSPTPAKKESSQPRETEEKTKSSPAAGTTIIPLPDKQFKDIDQPSPVKAKPSNESLDTPTGKINETVKKEESTRSSSQITSSRAQSANRDEQKITTTSSTSSTPSRTGTSTSTTTTTRRTTPTSTTVQKTTTTSTKGKSGERINSTEVVTSSYGIGPVDDDGTPLFGLRALRKIKQAQEEQEAKEAIEEAASDDNENQKSLASRTSNTATTQGATVVSTTSYTTSLRSNDMYGLRALRRQAEESNKMSSDDEVSQRRPASSPSPRSSSVEKDRSTITMSSSTQSSGRSTLRENGESFPKKSNNTEIEEVVVVEEEEIVRGGDIEDETCFAGAASTTTTETFSSSAALTSNDSRKLSSPKSILKKTSSFSSTSSPPRKNSGDRGSSGREDLSSPVLGSGSEEPIPETRDDNSSRKGKKTDGETSTTRSTTTTRKNSNSGVSTTTTTVTTTEKRKMSGGKITSMDDESWRRQRSHSPSPKLVASSSTASSIATFSRGKVGRSSVREMSKRFEHDEEMSKSNSSTSLSSDMRASSLSRESSPSLMSRGSRAESPSRIPLSIKSTTVVSTSSSIPSGENQLERDSGSIRTTSSGTTAVSSQMETFETGGVTPGGGEVSIQGSRQLKCQQRQFETAGGTISVTSNVVQTRVVTSSRGTTTTSSTRSFLNDQSPIQNLEDVIDRMRGEDPELMKTFNSEEGDGTVIIQSNNQGRNLLNKFIGAQVIMQAVEPLLISQKVSMSMSSSLEQSGGMDSDTESPTIREVIENCESETEQETKQRSVHTRGGNSSVEITEISSSSTPHLIHQSSTVSESAEILTGGSTTAAAASSKSADVSGELMPLILGQLQSSLDTICSASAGVIGAGVGASAVSALSSHNSKNYVLGTNHQSSSSSSFDIPYSSNDKNYGLNVTSNHKSSDHTTSSSSSYAHQNNGNGTIDISSANEGNCGGGGSESSIVCRGAAGTEEEEQEEAEAAVDEESSTSSSSSEEECLFDSGTESGEDLSTNANVDGDSDAVAAAASLKNTESSAAAIGPSIALSSSATNANTPLEPVVLQTSSSASVVDSQGSSKYDDVATSSSEFSCFIEGLKNSLKRNTNKESILRSYYNNNSSSDCGGTPPTTSSLTRDPPSGGISIGSGIANLQRKYLESSSSVCADQSKSNIEALLELQRNTSSSATSNVGGGSEEQERILKRGEEENEKDAGLIQQVDKVLTLLRDSIVKDPNCLGKISGNPDISSGISACSDPSKGKELIALIDRLKSSLSSQEDHQYDKENSFVLNPSSASLSNVEKSKKKGIADNNIPHSSLSTGSRVGESVKSAVDLPSKMMIGYVPQALPPDLSRSQSNPWVGDFLSSSSSSNEQTLNSTPSSAAPSTEHINSDNNSGSNIMTMTMSGSGSSLGKVEPPQQNASGGVPWKIRLAKRRSQPRSHTIGVTEEELAQARRLFEESTGFRFDSSDQQRQQQQQHHQQYNKNDDNNAQQAAQQQQYSIYSNMQDLSSLGNLESVTNNNNLNNINNYSMSDARAVGKVPTSDIFTSSDNLPLSPTSTSSVPFPHDSLQMSGNSEKDGQQEEMMPSSGGGCVSTTTTPTSWQTDVEKRLTSIPRPFVKHATQFYEGYQPPPERRMTYASIDDSCPIAGGVIGNLKIKPFRTYSLDNNKTSTASYNSNSTSSSYDDPSKSLFTPQETVQIAIHQAAIKKQMSEEEDRRKRRNSLTSYQNYENGVKPERNFALGMPKPYSPPKKQPQLQSGAAIQQNGYSSLYQSADSGYTEESGTESHPKDDRSSTAPNAGAGAVAVSSQVNDAIPSSSTMSSAGNSVVNINGSSAQNCVTTSGNTVTYTASPAGGFMQQQQQQQNQQQSPSKRIENVQISLKELNSSEFPQLQIAITLNTNNSSSSDNNNSSGSGHINVTTSSDGGQNTFARMPTNVTTTTSGASVTTNLQLGGNNAVGTAITSSAAAGGSSNTNANAGNGNSRQMVDVSGCGSTQYFSNDEGQQNSTSMSRAIRYKSKNERKKRMKRANTIDIPHPPGLILHHNDDDDTGMEDEEDSDNNTYRLGKSAGGNGGSGGVTAYGQQFNKHQPFLAKTEGDKKFLAFLEKNNALGESRPLRPSYLGVNDRQWNSRFSNLKTSFDTSSQGSSPSASPIPSPMRQPRSVSEMALSQERRSASTGGDSFSKPVWANTDKSQLPPQVRNKLHVFENKSLDGAGEQLLYMKSPPPSVQAFHQNQQSTNPYGRMMMMPGMKQTVSTNALNQTRGGQQQPSSRMMQRPTYSSHDNMALVGQKRNFFQGNSFDSKQQQFQQQQNQANNMRKPMPVRLQQHSLQDLPTTDHSQSLRTTQQKFSNQSGGKPISEAGVHMIHATATAMEAMKKSAFVPTSSSAVVPGHTSHQSMPYQSTSKAGGSQDERVDLPWAKRAHEPASAPAPTRDHNSGRVLVSKSRFEQPQLPTSTQIPSSNLPHQGSVSFPHSQPHPPLQQQSYSLPAPKPALDSPVKYQADVPPNSTYNKSHLPQSTSIPPSSVQQPQKMTQQHAGNSAEEFVAVSRPNLKTFGVTQSFDEAFKRKLDQQVASGSVMHPDQQNVSPTSAQSQQENQYSSGSPKESQYQQKNQSIGPSTGSLPTLSDSSNASSTKRRFEQSSESAFARQIPTTSEVLPTAKVSTENVSEVTPTPGQEGMIFTPVVSKVMRGPQQQRATTATNRMSSLNDDEQNTRLTGARSNLRNFLNLHQQSVPGMPATENAKRDASPIIPSKPQQLPESKNTLNVPPQLAKSLSGDAITTSQAPSSSPLSVSNVADSQEIRRSQESVRPTKVDANVEQEQRPVVIPRQKSLSEFPKISSAPKIAPLTIDTDVFNLAKQQQQQAKNINVQQSKASVQTQQQAQQQSHHHTAVQQQRNNANAAHQQQFHLSQQHQQQLQQHQQKLQILQQQQQATSKTTRSYPDTLHRTSSGSSIFSRAKNLFFGNQDGAPPSTKLRPKLPSASQPKITFPKQFEAQMSPESADRKQRELAAYFKQQHQELLQQQQQLQKQQDSALRGVESKAIKIADAVSKSETSGSSSITVECEQSEMQASASIISSSVNSSSSTATTKMQSVSSTTTTTSSSSSSISVKSVSKSGAPALPTTPMNRFKAMDQQANPGKKTGAPLFKFTNEGLKASATSAKDILLYWCQCRTREYENVKIENFSSAWSDGLAFCALIHHFYPDAFDYNSLNPRNRKHNFDLAFRIAEEKAGIYPLLDTEDMVAMGTRPDWKCVFTYVQSMYQKLKDL